MKKKSQSLSILMLKAGVTEATDSLKSADDLERCDLSINANTWFLFYKQNPTHPPSWVQLFKPHAGSALDKLYNSGTAAVLLVQRDGRHFAVTFGYGRALLRPDCYEENFGLRVVLNSVDPEKLRSVDAQTLDAVPVHVRSQASVATTLTDFGVDIERDLIYAATGRPKDADLGKQITGKDALKLTLPVDLTDLPDLLAKLLTQFSSTAYKENFAWIDHLSEVRDPSLVRGLDAALVTKIRSGDFTRTWLSVPEIVDWADIGGVKYQQPKRGDLRDDIHWRSYLEFVGNDESISVDTLRRHSVLAMSEASDQPLYHWPVYRCVYCELALGRHTYSLNNGKWYRVDADFLGELDAVIKAIPPASIHLPDYTDGSEAEYNERVADSDRSYFALMDKKMIRHGGGSSQIEFCDLFTTDRRLIHVKRYGGSSVLSHLFAQGLVATRLLLADSDFRRKVNEKLPESHRIATPEAKPTPSDFEVVYAVASNVPADRFELPLFSKVNLRNCYSQLQLLGIKVSLALVRVTGSGVAESATP